MGKDGDVASVFCAPKYFSPCVLEHWNLPGNGTFALEPAQEHSSPARLLNAWDRVPSLCLPGTDSQLWLRVVQ